MADKVMAQPVLDLNVAAPAPAPAAPKKPIPKIHRFLEAVARVEGTDVHLKADVAPRIRKKGELIPTNSGPLSNDEIEAMVQEIVKPAQWEEFQRNGQIDLAYPLTVRERFRINIFRQRGQISLAARRINPKIPTYSQLHLPPIMEQIAENEQGLILLAGITGSGKSTTIAAMLEQVNERRSCHVVTIENPIEYTYVDRKALINQREIGLDCDSYDNALRALMREDPDVVLIGEMRDRETFQAGIIATETGHLVFSTIHAGSAPGAITRILELFPTEMHANMRQAIATNMKAIIFQKLVPSIQKGVDLVPVVEVMLSTPAVRKYILDGRENELRQVILAERGAGMIDFNEMLVELVEKEMVHPREAYAASPNAEELRMRMRGIRTAGM